MATIKTKKCTQCGRVLPITEFHRRQHYVRRGVRAACKDCTREAAKEARKKRPGERDQNKERVRAETHRALRKRELKPQPCRICGDLNTQTHHPEYEGEEAHLRVEWLCPRHHALAHGKRAWTKQAELFPGL